MALQINIYDVRHAEAPTHIRTSFKDEFRNKAVVKTVYTGKLRVHHGASGDGTVIIFQYPLLGFFRQKNNNNEVSGIIPIDHERQFLGAAAMAAFSNMWIKDTNSIAEVSNIHADLFRVDLAPTNFQILAVVLTGFVHARDAEVTSIDYHVTVLTGLSDKSKNRFGAPILSNTPNWNGTYGAIGASPVQRGRPSEDLP